MNPDGPFVEGSEGQANTPKSEARTASVHGTRTACFLTCDSTTGDRSAKRLAPFE